MRISRWCLPALLIASLFVWAGCTSDAPEDVGTQYGEAVSLADALPASTLRDHAADYVDQDVVVEGQITQVCANRGCWIALDTGAELPLRIDVARTADDEYTFTVPTDVRGWAVATGQITPVESDDEDAPRYRLVADGIHVTPPADDADDSAHDTGFDDV